MSESSRRYSNLEITAAILALGGLVGLGYTSLTLKNDVLELAHTKTTTEEQLRVAIAELQHASTTITALQQKLNITAEELDEIEEDYIRERERNEEFEEEYRDVINTIYDLDKLSKTDEELLQKYSKVYFLNENYIPEKLRKIDDKYVLAGREQQYFHGDALPFLEDLLEAAADDGLDIKVISAYRSFDQQAQLKGAYTQTYGTGANTFSADQGYSEHQLGTTVDLTDPETAGPYVAFEETEEFAWLQKNAHKHGFILSYPHDNTFYVYEPWHWRFVGEELADYLHDNTLDFYDVEQRKIDTYLINIFD